MKTATIPVHSKSLRDLQLAGNLAAQTAGRYQQDFGGHWGAVYVPGKPGHFEVRQLVTQEN